MSLGEFPSRQDTYKGLIKPRTTIVPASASRISEENTSRSCLKPKTNEMHDGPLDIEYFKFERYYPHGDKSEGETEEGYVDRLMSNLENQIALLGADTIAAIWVEPVSGAVSFFKKSPWLYCSIDTDDCATVGSRLSTCRTKVP